MASACVTNTTASPESFLDCPPACPSYSWTSPRVSFSRDLAGDLAGDGAKVAGEMPDPKDLIDFEFRAFRLEDPVAMLPADELFSGGKLVTVRGTVEMQPEAAAAEIPSPEPLESKSGEILRVDPSPKAPRCSSRWRELLGLKRQQQQGPKTEHQKPAGSLPSKNPNPKSLKNFLHRNPKSSPSDPSLSLPLLGDSESVSVPDAGTDREERARLSLDAEKPGHRNPPRVRVARAGSASARAGRSAARRAAPVARGPSVDSPRMNSSGRVVFQGLERSSSSPSSFNGGPRVRHRGMERSYSAGVRITPVLNVPVFGLGQLFTQQKKDKDGAPMAKSGGSIRGKVERA